MTKASFMEQAIDEAKLAWQRGEIPIGAVIVQKDTVIARAGNRTLELNDPTAHAEILAIRQAGETLSSQRLTNCDLYVTLEPCPMCAAAISFARIRRLYFGASDQKSGGVENGTRFYKNPTCHHRPEVYSGIAENDCGRLLREFFENQRSRH